MFSFIQKPDFFSKSGDSLVGHCHSRSRVLSSGTVGLPAWACGVLTIVTSQACAGQPAHRGSIILRLYTIRLCLYVRSGQLFIENAAQQSDHRYLGADGATLSHYRWRLY